MKNKGHSTLASIKPDDLQEFSDREAFEDMVAEREYDSCFDDYTEIDGDFDPVEDSYLDSAYEDRTEFYY